MENIEDNVVTSVLTDALTRYMRYLEVEQELHESSQPRWGKGVQTDTDLARTEYFRARTVTTESCLQLVSRIAENVKRWAMGGEGVENISRGKEKKMEVDSGLQDENLIHFMEEDSFPRDNYFKPVWKDEDDEPYINPMTGQWITPITPKSAGPSNTQGLYEEPSRKPSSSQVLKAEESLPPQIVEVRNACVPDILGDLQRRTQPKDVSIVSEPASQLNIIPNLLDLDDDNPPPYEALLPGPILPPTNLFTDHLPSRQSSTNTPGSNTPNTSSRDTNPEPEDTLCDYKNEREQITNLHSEWALGDEHFQDTLQLAFPLENATAPSQFDLDHLAALKLQTLFDNEAQQSFSVRSQDGYAQQLEQEERTRFLDLSADMEVAKRLQHEWEAQDGNYEQNLKSLQNEWAQEDRMLQEQAAFADAMRRDEEANDETIRRDQAAAMAAQNQWEQEAREAEESTRSLREQIEREEVEEMERRAAIEEAKRLSEELERHEEEERQRLAAEAAEVERRERQADCVVCMEPSDKVDMCWLSCEHYYCRECIIAAFNTALTSRAPFTCCARDPVPASVATDFLPAQTVTQYDLLVLELITPNPRYCSNRNCRLFIPPNLIHGPVAVCPSCRTRTCSLCNNAEHAGVCAEDREGAAVVAMAQGKGWKPCPRCSALVEKKGGCLHMTCGISSCRAQWCWECLRDWSTCNSTCRRA